MPCGQLMPPHASIPIVYVYFLTPNVVYACSEMVLMSPNSARSIVLFWLPVFASHCFLRSTGIMWIEV